MRLETNSSQAFDLLREARQSLDRFKLGKDREQLKQADRLIEKAIKHDPLYLRAFYYRGMVRDLLGQPREAVSDFELVLNQRPPFSDEVTYNLGVALFHMSGLRDPETARSDARSDTDSLQNIRDAISHFEDIIESTDSQALRLFARVNISDAYAVMMTPRPEKETESCAQDEEFFEKAKEHVAHYHELSLRELNKAEAELTAATDLKRSVRDEVKWRLCNTRAVLLMLHTDYFIEDRIKKLKEARDALLEADRLSPNNWSVYCNLGSTFMRLGYWLKAQAKGWGENYTARSYFNRAIIRLDKVVRELLPDYGFALYELARVYRLKGDFDAALRYLDRAADVHDKTRTVSDRTLRCERELAEKRSADFPFPRADASSN